MKISIIKKLEAIQNRYKKLENFLKKEISTTTLDNFHMLAKEHKKLTSIVSCFQNWQKVQKNIFDIKELIENDVEIREIAQEELCQLKTILIELEKKLYQSLLSIDPNDKLGCIFEIHSGTGGNEASLFVHDLFRMYSRYAEKNKWIVDIIHSIDSEYGGYKEITFKVSHKGAYGLLKFESGGHRVQRVPNTESQGRIHTSTSIIAVIPEIPDKELPIININELRIDTYRSSGAGGQHVNTTDSAVRITHIPTGLVVECQDERSQHKNKAKALSVLGSRLIAMIEQNKQKQESYIKRNLLGSGNRSDRIRTYNFQKGRITDHRIGLTLHRLNEIIEGNLDLLIQPLIQQYCSNQLTILAEDTSL